MQSPSELSKMDRNHSKLWQTRYKNVVKQRSRDMGKKQSEYEIEEIVSSRFNTTKSMSSPDISETEDLMEQNYEGAKWDLTAENLSLYLPHYSSELRSRLSSTSSLLACSSSSVNVLKQTRAISNLITEDRLQEEIDRFENNFLTGFQTSTPCSFGDFANNQSSLCEKASDLEPLATLIPPVFGSSLITYTDNSCKNLPFIFGNFQVNPHISRKNSLIKSNESQREIRELHKSPAFSHLRTSSNIFGTIPAAEDLEVKSDKNIPHALFMEVDLDNQIFGFGDLSQANHNENVTRVLAHREIKPASQKSTWTLGITNHHSWQSLSEKLKDIGNNPSCAFNENKYTSLSDSTLCDDVELITTDNDQFATMDIIEKDTESISSATDINMEKGSS